MIHSELGDTVVLLGLNLGSFVLGHLGLEVTERLGVVLHLLIEPHVVLLESEQSLALSLDVSAALLNSELLLQDIDALAKISDGLLVPFAAVLGALVLRKELLDLVVFL